MPRPGFVHEVNERTPALVVHAGARLDTTRFPLGTRVVYAPEPGEAISARPAIRRALAEPVGVEGTPVTPLADRLRPGMRLTIAFSDTTTAVPPMRTPDVRGQAIEEILTLAAAKGVDDVALVCARGLARRLTEAELEQALGPRVYASFAPRGLIRQHDATDPNGLTTVVEAGSLPDLPDAPAVELDARAAASDLLVTVLATGSAQRTGGRFLIEGLAGEQAIAADQGLAGTRRAAAGEGRIADRLGVAVAEKLDVFAVEIALDTNAFGPELGFLNKREWEWSLRDQATLAAVRTGQKVVGTRARARFVEQARADSRVVAVVAGDPVATGSIIADHLTEQRRVPVDGQVDVMITGTAHVSPYGVGAWLNPLLAAHLALGITYGNAIGAPLVREGGSVIVVNDAEPRFHRHHTASADFFAGVLPDGLDADQVAGAEQRFAEDDWYRHLYRDSEAHHARQPFALWYAMERARASLGDVVWVGGDRQVCATMGFRAATTMADALEMVGGRDQRLGYVHNPPYAVVDVAGAADRTAAEATAETTAGGGAA